MIPAFSCSAFGLNVLSEMDLGPCLPRNGTIDAIFRFGTVKDRLEDPSSGGPLYQASESRLLLKIDGIARYLVSDGEQITIEREIAACDDTVRLFLLGSPVAALLHQRGVLPLHASAVVTPRGAVVFAGPSGCGKSTLAAALHLRGYAVLADEVCPVIVGSEHSVLPALPSVMLWQEAVEQLGLGGRSLRRARPEIQKYILPLGGSFATSPVPLHKIYILEAARSFALTPVSGIAKIRALSAVTHRQNFARDMHLSGQHFTQITAVAALTPIVAVSRPSQISRLQELADLLEEDFSR